MARDFVGKREGDRVGWILFGTRAYLQAPLTRDNQTVIEMLRECDIAAGKDVEAELPRLAQPSIDHVSTNLVLGEQGDEQA